MPKLRFPRNATPRMVAQACGIAPGTGARVSLDPIPGYTVSSRTAARYYARALGVATAKDAPLAELTALYHSAAAISAYETDAWPARAAGAVDVDPDDDEEPVAASTPAGAAEDLARALRGLIGPGVLDEARVREIAAEEAARGGRRVLDVTIHAPASPPVTIKGAHPMLPRIVQALGAGVHVFMSGPAGSGKTHLGEQAAEALGLAFYSTGAVDSPYALTGYSSGGTYHRTPFREAFEGGGLFLFDEIDGSDPAALLVINQALANGSMAFPDATMVRRHPDFRCLAAANTWGHGASREYVGRAELDRATLDRFQGRVFLDYDEALETELCGDAAWAETVHRMRRAAREQKIRIVLSMRASIEGARLLRAGWTRAQVLDSLLAGQDDASVTRLLAVAS